METPEQRTHRILANDAFKREHDQANTALYFASITLTNSPTFENLNCFIDAVQFQAKVFVQYLKPYENLQLRLRVIYKLEMEITNNIANKDFTDVCREALLHAHKEAKHACDEFGNLIPFHRPIERIKDKPSTTVNYKNN